MKKIFLPLILLLLPLAASAVNNLLYGPWVHQVDEQGFTVLWISREPSLDFVQVAPDDGTAFERQPRARYYENRFGRRVASRYHCVRIDSLKPGTTYRYRIIGKVLTDDSSPYRLTFGPSRRWGPRKGYYQVRTLNPDADTVRFSMFNDIHFNDARYAALASGMDVEKSDFILLNGDIVSFAQLADMIVKHTIAPIQEQAGKLPIVYCRGNHECRGTEFYKVIDLFPTPTGEFFYSFRQGPAAFIVLDTGEDKPDSSHEYAGTTDFDGYRNRQVEWLKKAVKDPAFVSAPIKICVIHGPTLYNKGSWYGEVWNATHLNPILEQGGIDLMLSGHYHRWICSEAGQDGKNFPILVNSNVERMDVVVTASSVDVKTYTEDRALSHQWDLKK